MNYVIKHDDTHAVHRAFSCAAPGCTASSGFVGSEDDCVEWARKHLQNNPGHDELLRTWVDRAVMAPKDNRS
ncbi:hypothetical protein RKE29_20855 [Streptomyces sp. B1866]|uniref:DUF7848 domain-containing protein n=1 Tax=Streptomyces sp. B1866 TaxID=3075431 RepID=UPI00288DC77D|nr:hypothetical protein [Streptomyces sp. B1866]MDT3399064.1 hypothetical protein [Streptomyces sp. B1866]